MVVDDKTKKLAMSIIKECDEFDCVIEVCALALIGLCDHYNNVEDGMGDELFVSIIAYLKHNWEMREGE